MATPVEPALDQADNKSEPTKLVVNVWPPACAFHEGQSQ